MIAGVQRRLRLRAWAARLRWRLRRGGCALALDLSPGATVRGPLRVVVRDFGAAGGARVRIRIEEGVVLGAITLEVWGGGENTLEIGRGSEIGDGAVIQLQSGSIRLADHVQVRSWTVLKSAGELSLGPGAIAGHGCMLHCAQRIELGELVGLAERVTVIDSDHQVDGSDEYFMDRPVLRSPVRLGRNTFVATGAVVGRGATIGRNSVVAAGAAVRAGEYPDGWLIGGLPAKPIKPLGEAG